MKQAPLLFLLLAFPAALSAQACAFSEGRNLSELQRAAVFSKHEFSNRRAGGIRTWPQLPIGLPSVLATRSSTHAAQSSAFLPKWSAYDLPFFCKIEHDWGIKSKLPLKFRLGSVEYVDWLEGK